MSSTVISELSTLFAWWSANHCCSRMEMPHRHERGPWKKRCRRDHSCRRVLLRHTFLSQSLHGVGLQRIKFKDSHRRELYASLAGTTGTHCVWVILTVKDKFTITLNHLVSVSFQVAVKFICHMSQPAVYSQQHRWVYCDSNFQEN